jgi:hypothetical protein
MAKYAENTTVSAEKSRAEIETTLRRYGADAFSYGWEESRAVISFRAKNRIIRFEINMPDRNAKEFTHYTRGRGGYLYERTDAAAYAAWEQAGRQKWRALALVVKAKLEAVESGISEFENEFLANIVMPDNRTVSQWITPQIATAYETGTMPKLLPPMGSEQNAAS